MYSELLGKCSLHANIKPKRAKYQFILAKYYTIRAGVCQAMNGIIANFFCDRAATGRPKTRKNALPLKDERFFIPFTIRKAERKRQSLDLLAYLSGCFLASSARSTIHTMPPAIAAYITMLAMMSTICQPASEVFMMDPGAMPCIPLLCTIA